MRFTLALLLSFWGTFLVVNGQLKPEKFRSVTIDDGLSQGFISDIVQDEKGFLWIGTLDGLNRFDGVNFKIFREERGNPHSLSQNGITDLHLDAHGRLWIGTSGAGLNMLFLETEEIQRLTLDPDSSSQSLSIRQIREDPWGNIWVMTSSDYLFEIRTKASGEFEVFTRGPVPRNRFDPLRVSRMLLSSDSLLYFSSDEQLLVSDLRKPKFELTPILNLYDKVSPERAGKILNISEFPTGDLILSTAYGFFHRAPGAFKFRFVAFDHEEVENPTRVFHLNDQGLLTAMIGPDLFQIPVEDFLSGHLPASIQMNLQFTGFIYDHNGNLWAGTNGFGLLKYSKNQQQFMHLFKEEVMYSILPVGTDSLFTLGYIIDLKKEKLAPLLTPFWAPANRLSLIPSTANPQKPWITYGFKEIYTDRPEGIRYGIIKTNCRTGIAKEHIFTSDKFNFQDLSFRNVMPIVDRENEGWLFTPRVLLHFDPDRMELLETFEIDLGFDPAGQHRSIANVIEDHAGNFWISTERGLVQWNKRQQKIIRPAGLRALEKDIILGVLEDDAGRFWIGTKGTGFYLYNPATNELKNYNTRNGLSNNVVYGMLPGNPGEIWMSTNLGLSCFEIETEKFRNFTVSDGLQSNEFNTSSFCKADDGTLFFGGMNGLTVFHPDDIPKNPFPPTPILLSLNINGDPILPQTHPDILPKTISHTQSISLSHLQNTISLGFSGLDFNQPNQMKLFYRLVGADDRWIEGGDERGVTYSQLRPGNYRFELHAENGDGVRSEVPATLEITILPPWWRTKMAFVGYILLALFIMGWVYRAQMTRISRRNRINNDLREAERLKELDDFKRRFYQNITHEFRTPLSLILGPVQQMLRDGQHPEYDEYLEIIQKNGENLLNLINQLLELSRLEAGSLKSEKRVGNLNAAIESAWYAFLPAAEGKRQTWTFESQIRGNDLLFDVQNLNKIVNNLLSNAHKFTPEGGKVQLRIFPDEAQYFILEVEDDGQGIPEAEQSQVFDRFYRAAHSQKTEQAGTGIGLALVKELSELMEGRITLRSAETTGIIFRLELPIKVEKREIPILKNLSEPLGVTPETNPETDFPESADRDSILIVEDNESMQKFISSIFLQEYEILVAENGETGLETALAKIPSLIISDVMMPGMDGMEMLTHIRKDERTSHIPVILLTARTSVEARLEGLSRGADAYLNKPFNPEELEIRVAQMIETRRKLQENFREPAALATVAETPLSDPDQRFLEKVKQAIYEELDNTAFSAEDLSAAVGMSRPNLYRKLKALTDLSVSHYIRAVRLARSRELLQSRNYSISEVGYMVGFSSNSYFSKCFREEYGVTPRQFMEAGG